jgi:hypothetical protein
LRKIIITKANGQKVPFDARKVESTCIRAGASYDIAKKIAYQVYSKIHYGDTTKEIYRMVLHLLSQQGSSAIKHRYQLKESIMRLGPAGFPFETYVGQILEHFGYKIKLTGTELAGKCVRHEIDLVMESLQDGKKWLVECKYHNMPGRYTGLKDSLYTHARFLDLADKFDGEMLVCNTKVSPEVIMYAECIGQKVLSWRYPPEMSLEKIVEAKKLYPITILGPTRKELESFAENKLMIAKDLLDLDVNEFSRKTRIPIKRIFGLQKTISQIIS